MLEAAQHEDNAFVTLTYAPEHYPDFGTLVPSHLSGFIKTLRSRLAPFRVRYYGVGEYGELSQHPHYHIALFGFRSCSNGTTDKRGVDRCCPPCQLVHEVWGKGIVCLGSLEQSSAGYIAGYVTKKWTRKDEPSLGGRHPEFARMSLKPGIGAGMMDEVASTLMEHGLDNIEDVPAALAHGRQQWPLGRYLRRNLRVKIGRSPNAPESTIKAMEEKLRPLREAAQNAFPHSPGSIQQEVFKQNIIQEGLGRRIQMEGRERRFKKRGNI